MFFAPAREAESRVLAQFELEAVTLKGSLIVAISQRGFEVYIHCIPGHRAQPSRVTSRRMQLNFCEKKRTDMCHIVHESYKILIYQQHPSTDETR